MGIKIISLFDVYITFYGGVFSKCCTSVIKNEKA